ncbi:MAG: hypothetical protein F6J93_21650 [Oscillatoria sp. SIO1A7]|nr:hypothetical protein [Oscillatoria sp. SIO1A7]
MLQKSSNTTKVCRLFYRAIASSCLLLAASACQNNPEKSSGSTRFETLPVPVTTLDEVTPVTPTDIFEPVAVPVTVLENAVPISPVNRQD